MNGPHGAAERFEQGRDRYRSDDDKLAAQLASIKWTSISVDGSRSNRRILDEALAEADTFLARQAMTPANESADRSFPVSAWWRWLSRSPGWSRCPYWASRATTRATCSTTCPRWRCSPGPDLIG
jgi:hypothetical protein